MKHRKTIVLLFTVVLLAVLYGAVVQVTGASRTKAKPQYPLVHVSVQQISEIQVVNQADTLVFQKKNGAWSLTAPAGLKYDQAEADALPLSLYYMSSDKLVTNNATDLAQYGLDRPAEITVKTRDGKLTVLEIGNLNSTKDSYYAKLKDGNRVYILDKNKAEAVLLTKNQIKDKNVLSLRREMRSVMIAADITKVTLKKNGTLVVSAEKNVADDSWTITLPTQAKGDAARLTAITNALSKVLALEFVDDNPDNFSVYGLDHPAYSIAFENSTGTKVLDIGHEKKTGSEFYARVEGSNDVFTIDEAGFTFLDTPLADFESK